MKNNLSHSRSANATYCTGCDLHLLQHCCYQHQTINQATLMCNQTCLTIDNLFMCHHHTWTVDHLCTFLYNQAFDKVCTLSCNWTLNIWPYSCDIITNKLHYCLSLQHCCSWTVHVYSVLWSHNNCQLSSYSHSYHFDYSCYDFTIADEAWYWTQYFWICKFEKTDYHPSHTLFLK